ncbi:branched-chain amino acid ABC transporter substrate-binding protein [Humibacillus xanthopallidus]|uniref:Amino acid/amide ABC transporter substrate-binding protein (HAAT family) n=1 Tax=Humibacillus xanthopallidus TaxID=412689 RepID=A0A543HIW0_9MICO|nr:branched-chain amino acid ABC transporter substrate-binding protein [Humibacillus xanthopallidus]TQM58278.1 amino acid/amide ABC transporter substrate-binding protein (HAAT family) [Humibacillus xanthopallidus]
MRSTLKFAVPLAVAALALGACGTTGGTSNTPAASGGAAACGDYKIGMFGALTGPNANLGIYIQNGVNLALDDYNKKHPDCKVTLENYDSQGDPTQAPALAKKAIDDKKVVGIVGPAFSGESKAANPAFAEAGLVHITPSATNPALAENGWKTFFRVLGNDATQGPAAAKYIKDTVKATKVFVIDDASEYGKGLADIVRQDLGSTVVGNDTIQQKQTDFGASVTKVTASGADALFFGGYSPEAAPLIKQLRDAGWKGTFVVADGVKDQSFIDNAQAAAEGTVITCPCVPADVAPDFQAAYKAKFNEDPNTYSGEGYDSATILLDGIAAGKDRATMVDFVKAYDKPGVTKQLKFDAKGEVTDVKVFAYKVEGGKIVSVGEIK